MNEEDVFVFFEIPLANQVDQSGHRLAGINRIQKDTFTAGQQLDGLYHGWRRQ